MSRKLLIAALAASMALLAGCGPSGEGAETDPEKGYDADYLNIALAQELTTLDLYTIAVPSLRGRDAAVARRFRGHQQEYVDAITKAIRGLGGDATGEAQELELPAEPSRSELLLLAYELEAAAVSSNIEAAPRLNTSAPRTLTAALAAGHAQHLVVLRRLLGAPLIETVPEAFEVGGEKPPGER
jgi:hypothetical protein